MVPFLLLLVVVNGVLDDRVEIPPPPLLLLFVLEFLSLSLFPGLSCFLTLWKVKPRSGLDQAPQKIIIIQKQPTNKKNKKKQSRDQGSVFSVWLCMHVFVS